VSGYRASIKHGDIIDKGVRQPDSGSQPISFNRPPGAAQLIAWDRLGLCVPARSAAADKASALDGVRKELADRIAAAEKVQTQSPHSA
jgi:hypothetical protein